MCRLVWAFDDCTYLYHIVGNLLSGLNCCIGCKAPKLTYSKCSQIVKSGVFLWLTALTICISNGLFFLAWNNILAWKFVTRSCLKPQNPCSNLLCEHGFYLKKLKLGPYLHALRYTGMLCGRDWSFHRCFRSRKRCTRIYDVVAT